MENQRASPPVSECLSSLSEPDASCFGKFVTYHALARLYPPPSFPIPETLLVSPALARPLFLSNGETGAVKTTTTNAVDAFYRAVFSLGITQGFSKPSAYKVPLFIIHTRTSTTVAFDQETARTAVDAGDELVLQRYIAPSEHIVKKLRVVWTAGQRPVASLLQRKSELPYNAPKVQGSALKPKRRNSVYLAPIYPDRHQRRGSQILAEELPQSTGQEEYIVSFRNAEDLTMREVGLSDRAPVGETIINYFSTAPQVSGLHRTRMTCLVFDLIPNTANHWLFLNVLKVAYSDAPLPASRKSIQELRASLFSEAETSRPPLIDLDEIQKQNIALYLRLHQS